MEPLTGSLVASEDELGFHTGLRCLLDTVAGVVILIAHDMEQELHLRRDSHAIVVGRIECCEEVLRGDRRVRVRPRKQLRDHEQASAGLDTSDRNMREDRPDTRRHLRHRPVILRHVRQRSEALIGLGVSLMRSPRVVDGLVVVRRTEGVLVKNREMVEVEVAVVGDLPIRTLNALLSHEMARLEPEMVQHAVVAMEEEIDVDAFVGGHTTENDAGALEHR